MEWYTAATQQPGGMADASQQAAMRRLQQLCDELNTFEQKRSAWLSWLRPDARLPRGVYLWGGVGRGKSWLMDGFFAHLTHSQKQRVHFHRFVADIHQELRALRTQTDPLGRVAAQLASRYRIICFDEFHVSDIADAMILGRLLEACMRQGVVFVMTSNYPPAGLYPDGLKRENFLPTIALLEQQLDVFQVEAGQDYRFRTRTTAPVYLCPLHEANALLLNQHFEAAALGADEAPHLHIGGRTFQAHRKAAGVIWFSFETLCMGMCSQRDYLEIIQTYPILILSDIPQLSPTQAPAARRLTWLVDVCYDQRIKLVVSAAVAPDALYIDGAYATEFLRTASRLHEMQTQAYMDC